MDVKTVVILTKIDYTHCEKGPVLCPKCKESAQKPVDFALVQLYSYSDNIRPTMEIDGVWYGYEVVQRFGSDNEAIEYAGKNNIRII